MLLSPSAAASFAPTLLNAVASAKEDVGELRVALTRAEARLEVETRTATERAQQLAEVEIRLAEEARRPAERRAEQAERRLAEAARRRAETERRAEQAERRLAEEVGQRVDTERRASQLEAERDHFWREHERVLNSTFWRLTGPLRRVSSVLPPGLRQYGRRGARLVYWLLTPHRTGERIAYFRSQRTKPVVLPAPPVEWEKAAQMPAHADQLEPQLEKLATHDDAD